MGTVAAGVKGLCLFGGHHAGYPRSGVLLAGLQRLGVPVVSCVASPRWKLPRRYAVLATRYALSKREFDVLFVPEFRHKDVPLAAGLAAASGKLCVFDPLVSRYDTRVHDRGDVGDAGPQAWHNRNLDRMAMTLPDLILADTPAHARYFRRELAPPDARIRVLEVGFDDTMFQPTPLPDDGVTRVLFYGSYLPLHGVHAIADAAAHLAARADIEFELIGGGQTFETVERVVGERGLSRVRLAPRVPLAELPRRIEASSICLGIFGETPKAGRVIPNKVFQCMGAGRPVISADTVAMRDTFEDGREIVLVPPGDGAALAGAIERLAADRARRDRIARVAAERVHREFSPLPLARRLVSLCREAMEG